MWNKVKSNVRKSIRALKQIFMMDDKHMTMKRE